MMSPLADRRCWHSGTGTPTPAQRATEPAHDSHPDADLRRIFLVDVHPAVQHAAHAIAPYFGRPGIDAGRSFASARSRWPWLILVRWRYRRDKAVSGQREARTIAGTITVVLPKPFVCRVSTSRGEPKQSAGRTFACRSSKSPGSRVAGCGKTASVRPQAVLPGPLFAQERSMRSEPGLLRIASGISVSDRSVAPHVGPLGRLACLGAAQAGYCCRLLFSRGRRVSGGPTLRHCGLGAGP